MAIGIFNCLDEGGEVDDAVEGLPNAWQLTLPVQARNRLFDFLKQSSGAQINSAAKQKRPLTPTEEDVAITIGENPARGTRHDRRV